MRQLYQKKRNKALYLLGLFWSIVCSVSVSQAQEPPAYMGRVIIVGDRSAYQVSMRLKETLAGKADVEYAGQQTIRDGFMEGNWPKVLEQALAGKQKPFAVVVLLSFTGEHEGGIVELTGFQFSGQQNWEKVAAPFLQSLKNTGIPFLWVSTPPTANEQQSEVIDRINIAIREKVPPPSSFVDIWPAFTDEDGRYFTNGPDMEGKTIPLRDKNGFSFTPAGAQKVAYFIGVALDQLQKDIIYFQSSKLENSSMDFSVSVGSKGENTVKISKDILPPEESVILQSPVLPEGNETVTIRAMRDGIPAPFKIGRGDDMRWK